MPAGCIEMCTTYIFEIDIDAVWKSDVQFATDAARLVVEGMIETELFLQVSDLIVRTATSNHPAIFNFCYLTYDAAYCAGRGRNKDILSIL